MGSCGVVGLTLVHRWGCSVYPGTLGSLRFALRVVGFIRGLCVSTRVRTSGRSVHSHSPWVTLGSPSVVRFTLVRLVDGLDSSGIVGFTRVRPWYRWVHPR